MVTSLDGPTSYHNLGIHIPSPRDAIESIDRGCCRANVECLKKMFVAAGGVERAADLVEFYQSEGYSHLIPAYAKLSTPGSGCNTTTWMYTCYISFKLCLLSICCYLLSSTCTCRKVSRVIFIQSRKAD